MENRTISALHFAQVDALSRINANNGNLIMLESKDQNKSRTAAIITVAISIISLCLVTGTAIPFVYLIVGGPGLEAFFALFALHYIGIAGGFAGLILGTIGLIKWQDTSSRGAFAFSLVPLISLFIN